MKKFLGILAVIVGCALVIAVVKLDITDVAVTRNNPGRAIFVMAPGVLKLAPGLLQFI